MFTCWANLLAHFTKFLWKYWTLDTKVLDIICPHSSISCRVDSLKLPFLTNWLAEAKFNSTNWQEIAPYAQHKKSEQLFREWSRGCILTYLFPSVTVLCAFRTETEMWLLCKDAGSRKRINTHKLLWALPGICKCSINISSDYSVDVIIIDLSICYWAMLLCIHCSG